MLFWDTSGLKGGYHPLSALKRRENFWIEAVLEKKSLDTVINFLHNITGKPVMVADRTSKVYAWSEEVKMASADDHFIEIPRNNDGSFNYDPAKRNLYYHTGFTDRDACIIINNVSEAEYAEWIKHLEEVATAVKVFIFTAHEAEKMEHQFKKKLIEDILLWNASEIKELIRQNKYYLDLDKLYFVSIMEPVLDSKTDMVRIRRQLGQLSQLYQKAPKRHRQAL
ncbi:MAG: PucR family transcriptional regulator, proline-responsive transcriptional activator [Thermacetogenium sp.]|nr:PucR family transcriptional regulator, proline-responsive transcriptional activator [Thermacetogenium sp.]